MSTGATIPTKYGGYATFPTWIASHGIYDVFYNTIYQDQWGVIRQQRSGRPSKNDDVIVGAERNPSPNGFALVGWGDNIQGGRPLEVESYQSFSFILVLVHAISLLLSLIDASLREPFSLSSQVLTSVCYHCIQLRCYWVNTSGKIYEVSSLAAMTSSPASQ